MPDTRARGLDISGTWQRPADMDYAAWRARGYAYVIIEACRGTNVVPFVAEHRAKAHAAGMLVGIYCFLLHGHNPAASVRTLDSQADPSDELPQMADVEDTTLTASEVRAFCDAHDMSHAAMLLYTGKWEWEQIIPAPQRIYYLKYPLVIGAYPFDAGGNKPQKMDPASVALRSTPPDPVMYSPILPAPWGEPLDVWWAWQHTGHGRLPGYADDLDLEVSSMTEAQLMAQYRAGAFAFPLVPRGSLTGIHAINPDHSKELAIEAAEADAPFSGIKLLNDAQALAEIKQAIIAIKQRKGASWTVSYTYLRYYDPADDSLQGLDDWSIQNENDWCDRVLYKIYSQIKPEQCPFIDWACAWNEEDPPGRWGYQKLGETFLRLGAKNEARKAAGLPYVKLAFGCLSQGTPELWEIDELIATGLFAWMQAHGYIWDAHEGAFAWQKIDTGVGDKLPSTPAIKALGPGHGDVPAIPGSGSGSLRFVWMFEGKLRALGQLVGLWIGEWYPGVLAELDRYWWYDDQVSQYEYLIAFACYNLGPTRDWPNLLRDFQDAAFKAHRIAVRNRINGPKPKETTVPITQATLDSIKAARAAAQGKLNELDAIVAAIVPDDGPAAHTWAPGDVALAVANPIQLYDALDGQPSGKPRPNYTSDINVFEVSVDGLWLRVFNAPALWVRAADVSFVRHDAALA